MLLFFKVYIKSKIHLSNFLSRFLIAFYRFIYSNRFRSRSNILFGQRFSLFLDNSESKVDFGNKIQFRNNVSIRVIENSTLFIDNNVFFNNNCSINCMSGIHIGENSIFGESVKIYDHNHQYKDINLLVTQQGYSKKDVIIGKNCWIGSNVIILKGVTIGDNSVIGAGCVIYKSVPSNTVIYNNQNLSITHYKD